MKRAAIPADTTARPVASADLESVDGGFSLGFNLGFSLKLGSAPRPAVVAAAPVVYPQPVVYAPPVVAAPVYTVGCF